MEYTTKTAIENYLMRNIDVSFDVQLTQYIAAMSEHIDRTIGYPLYRQTATTRLYDGNDSTVLKIDPVHTITAITLNDTEITPTEAPYNNGVKYELRLQLSTFLSGQANVAVTGIHAKSVTLPDSMKWACTVLVALIVQNLDDKLDGVQSEKIGQYQVTYKDGQQRTDFHLAKTIIDSYRSIAF